MLTTDTVDALHRHLNAHPGDHQARLILADALEDVPELEHLAEGYRALAALDRLPFPNGGGHLLERSWATWSTPEQDNRGKDLSALPADWCGLIRDAGAVCEGSRKGHFMIVFHTRRESEDAAALAFSRLPAARRAELLAGGA